MRCSVVFLLRKACAGKIQPTAIDVLAKHEAAFAMWQSPQKVAGAYKLAPIGITYSGILFLTCQSAIYMYLAKHVLLSHTVVLYTYHTRMP